MPKGVIVLLVVVAMVFVVTLALGAGRHDEPADAKRPPGIVEALGDLGGSRPLRIEDGVGTSCDVESPALVRVNGSCSIDVPSRGAFSRPVKAVLRPLDAPIDVVVRPREGEVQDGEAPNSESPCFASAIDHEGGRIDVACPSGGPCRVELREDDC